MAKGSRIQHLWLLPTKRAWRYGGGFNLTCFLETRANGYNWQSLPDEPEIRRNLESLARDISDSPAALGVFLHDEPCKLLTAFKRTAELHQG